MKKRSDKKQLMDFNVDPLAFQKAHNEQKWLQNYKVMIQSPEPIKPVLHLSQLEANRFSQFQTKNWLPGDQYSNSGGSSNY